MDLSEFDKTIKPLPEKVLHVDKQTGNTIEAQEMEIVWKHKYLPVSELKFYIREDHEQWTDKVSAREQEILEIWMKELKYDSTYYRVENKIIVEKGKVTDQGQIDTWKKPNPETHVPAEDTEVL